jgi:hypothetical protein
MWVYWIGENGEIKFPRVAAQIAILERQDTKMSDEKRSQNLIPGVGFRVLTCRIKDEDDSAEFTDTPLIGWMQTNDPCGDPVDPIILDGNPILGSELAAYDIAYEVFPAEYHDGQRFRLKARLEKEARSLLAASLKKLTT